MRWRGRGQFQPRNGRHDLLGDLPADMEETVLLQTMKEHDDIQKEIVAIIEAWKSGDADVLDTILLKSFKDYPGVHKRLIVDRNKNWLPKIESLLGQKENVMIIVGAAHLVGKDGVIAVLKQRGYQVEQL